MLITTSITRRQSVTVSGERERLTSLKTDRRLTPKLFGRLNVRDELEQLDLRDIPNVEGVRSQPMFCAAIGSNGLAPLSPESPRRVRGRRRHEPARRPSAAIPYISLLPSAPDTDVNTDHQRAGDSGRRQSANNRIPGGRGVVTGGLHPLLWMHLA